jgi:hypothetical protein
MKNLKTLFLFLFIGITGNVAKAITPEAANYNQYDGKAYIFIEGGVEFSVFPDGQFDFLYVGPQNGTEVVFSTPGVNISFNGGRDYEAYAQYDDYGAIVQVEDVPVFYDEYGRIIQAGTVDISYRNRRLVRVGGLNIFYNNYGYYDYCVGYINPFNRFYVYRPWHAYYVRPIYNNCIVWDVPYRRYYSPVRYSYYNHVRHYNNRYTTPYRNSRRDFYSPGSRVHYSNGRTAINRNHREGRSNTMVNNHGRRETSLASTNTSRNKNRTTVSNKGGNREASTKRRDEKHIAQRSNTYRTKSSVATRDSDRYNARQVVQNSSKAPRRNNDASRQKTRTTKSSAREVARSTTNKRTPKVRSQRTTKPVAKSNTSRSINKTASSSRKTNTRKTAKRSSSKNNTRGKTRSSDPKKGRGL